MNSHTLSTRIVSKLLPADLMLALILTFGLLLAFGSGAVVSGQTPGGVGGGSLWLKANTGASPSAWLDQSGGANDFTQTITPQQPTLTGTLWNFNPTFHFNGSQTFNRANSTNFPLGASPRTFFSVSWPSTLTGEHWIFSYGSPGNNVNQGFISFNNAFAYVSFSGLTNDHVLAGEYTTYPRLISSATFNGTQSQLWSQGRDRGTRTASPIWNTTDGPALIGARSDTTRLWLGEIPELIFYNRVLTANERQRVESYLAVKYGVTLDQTAPTNYLTADSTVVWDAATNTIYNNDITGIGRDDVSALNQKQSASVNAGNLLTIGHVTIAVDNQSNPNNFPADKDFLIWGHNAGATTISVLVTGASAVRMARVWRVQETAGVPLAPEAVNNVVVRVPQSVFGTGAPVLIRSTDATFDVSDDFIPMTANGADYDATINFNNGDFFTFGRLVPTAANVSISGRVMTANGRGIANARVALIDPFGIPRTVATNPFGYYSFADVPAGQTYVAMASAKGYVFDTQTISVADNIEGLNFIALE